MMNGYYGISISRRLLPVTVAGLLLCLISSCENKEIRRNYYPAGSLESEWVVVNEKKNGPLKLFYEDGKLKYEGTFQNDLRVGVHFLYYPSGIVNFEIHYEIKDEKRHGPVKWIEYRADGTKEVEMVYAEKKINVSALHRTGNYTEGDSITLVVEIVDPKYVFIQAMLYPYDENLNALGSPSRPPPEVINSDKDNKVYIKTVITKAGDNVFTGLARDYTLKRNDSSTWEFGENSFFEFHLFANEKTSTVN